MNQQNNVLRQVKDIQAQAARLETSKPSLEEIIGFASFAQELRTYLLAHVKDEFILNYLKEIPVLHPEKLKRNNSATRGLLAIAINGISGAYKQQRMVNEALVTIKEIKNKYAASQMMMQNYFE